jgi:hemoglobin
MEISEPNAELNFSVDFTPYQALGGDQKVRQIVDTFYDLMDLEPEFTQLRAVHHASLTDARDKLYWFLSGWLGGPQLYQEKFGHPRLRMRHMPFRITSIERDQWIACMGQALTQCEVSAPLHKWLTAQLYGTADWMRNAPD